MRVSVPRLKSVKLKSGGAKLHVIRNNSSEQLCGYLLKDIQELVDMRKTDLLGYAVVAWGRDGTTTTVHVPDGRWIGRLDVPEVVKNALMDYIANT